MRNTRSTHLSIRLMPSLAARLDEFAAKHGIGRSDAVRKVIIEAVLDPEERASVAERAEILRLATEKMRTIGSVAAMRLLLEEIRRDALEAKHPRSAIDQLAARRHRGGRAGW